MVTACAPAPATLTVWPFFTADTYPRGVRAGGRIGRELRHGPGAADRGERAAGGGVTGPVLGGALRGAWYAGLGWLRRLRLTPTWIRCGRHWCRRADARARC